MAMDNYSYPNSRDSSPRSRDVLDNENPSTFEEPPPSCKVKLMCSYGGKIQPRPHDNNLSYIGGDTKILAVDRNIKFSAVMAKLSSLTNSIDFCFKYQLPGEDLDSLISVTNEEDLDHMMVEYDRLCRTSPRPARLRLFLFPLNNTPSINLVPTESKPEKQWFVDALNSVQVPSLEAPSPSPPPLPAVNPDFLFGLDNAYPAVPAAKQSDFPEIPAKDAVAGSECESEDRQTVRESEIQEIQLQRLQLGNNEQRKNEEENGRVYGVDYYHQKNSEKVAPFTTHAPASQVHSGPVPVHAPGPVSVQASFLPERHIPGGGYPLTVSANGNEPGPVYLIQTPSGMYQAVRPVTGPMGQPVYFLQPPGSVSLSHSQATHKIAYNVTSEGGVVSERGYSQVAYLPDRSALRRQAAAAPGGDGWQGC